jgi:AraC-like DNA-binding protein
MYPLTVDDLLAHCPASRSHFHALFKRHFGRTATEAINAIRIDRACAALQAGEGSMSDIAFACGFASQSRFNAVFRSLRGCSPRQWRARQLQDS